MERTLSGEGGELAVSAKKILAYLCVHDEPAQADVIFILGGAHVAPVEKAAELYHQKFAAKIAFISTGGKFGGDKIWGMSEQEKYAQVLESLGVPTTDMIFEGLTSNTLDEAKTAIPFLESHHLSIRKIILVSRPVHARRAWATFKKQHPNIHYMNCPGDEALDFSNQETLERLVGEIERLQLYAEKGDIERQEIPREIIQAAETVKGKK